MIEPKTFLEQWQGKPTEYVESALKELLNQQLENPVGHLQWAEIAEQLNCHSLAFREAQLAVKFEPENQDALFLLAQILTERGNIPRAVMHLETLLKLDPEHALAKALLSTIHEELGQTFEKQVEVPDESEELTRPDDYQAFRFLQAFGGREDSYARQWYTREQGRGGYTPVHAPLTPREIRNHLLGNETLGVYCLRLDQTVNFMVVDLDIKKSSLESARTNPERATQIREQLKALTHFLYNHLQSLELPALIENSGFKGRHLWILFSEPQPAAVAHVFGQLFLRWMTPHIPVDFHLEFFPKQAEASGKGMGNLIKLPLGIHRRSGRRSVFLNLDGHVIEHPYAWLEEFPRIDGNSLFTAIEKLKTMNLPVLFPLKKADSVRQPQVGPAPIPVAPAWTETDFDSCHPIQYLLKACPVLRALKKQVESHRQLSLEEQLTLIHSLGHLPEGVLALTSCPP